VRIAVEDVGLADPSTLRRTLDAAEAWDRLGSPEGELALVQAAVLLARAPKSNALYVGYGRAQADVESTSAEPVPLHLRNAATGLLRGLGWGEGYRYVHDDPAAREEMSALPPSLAGRRYLAPDGAEGAPGPSGPPPGPEGGRESDSGRHGRGIDVSDPAPGGRTNRDRKDT
jgi:putative ATPase